MGDFPKILCPAINFDWSVQRATKLMSTQAHQDRPEQIWTDFDRLEQTSLDYLEYLEYWNTKNTWNIWNTWSFAIGVMFLFSVYSALLYPHFVFPPWTLSSWLSKFKWIESAAWSDLCPLAPHRVIGRGKVVNRVLKYNPQFRFSYPPPTSQLGEMIGNARKKLRAAEKARLQIDLCDKVWL